MANFNIHFGAAAGIGAITSAYGFAVGWWPLGQAEIIVSLVTLGGIMPDIDADKSHSARLVFTVLAVVAAFAALVLARSELSLSVAGCLALGLYVGIRDVAGFLFRFFTRHRASWHSLLAVIGVCFSTVAISYRCFGQSDVSAWSNGLAIAGGMLVHLLLDECFSIDLEGVRLKRSFGTAFKLFDYRRPIATTLMSVVTLLILPAVPQWPF